MKKRKKENFRDCRCSRGMSRGCLCWVWNLFFRVISALEQPLTELKPVANQWKKLSNSSQRKSTAMC